MVKITQAQYKKVRGLDGLKLIVEKLNSTSSLEDVIMALKALTDKLDASLDLSEEDFHEITDDL